MQVVVVLGALFLFLSMVGYRDRFNHDLFDKHCSSHINLCRIDPIKSQGNVLEFY